MNGKVLKIMEFDDKGSEMDNREGLHFCSLIKAAGFPVTCLYIFINAHTKREQKTKKQNYIVKVVVLIS